MKIAASALPSHPAYRPVLDLVHDVLITAPDLALRWQYTTNHLSNLRNAQRGIPFVKLPGGAIRYRLSEILAAELAGTEGPPSLNRLELAIATCKALTEAQRAAVLEHAAAFLGAKGAG